MTEARLVLAQQPGDLVVTLPDASSSVPGTRITIDHGAGKVSYICVRIKDGGFDYQKWLLVNE